jgi:small subunit ribosomal protein S20
MAHHKSAQKASRQAEKKRIANKYKSKTTRNAVRKIKSETDTKEVEKALPTVVSMIDKLAKTNIIHKNKAAHMKSQLMRNTSKAS